MQVTIDGSPRYHNSARPLYSKAVEGAEYLGKIANLTVVSVLTEKNWNKVDPVLKKSEELGAEIYRVIRMIPVRKELIPLVISKEHTIEVVKYLREARKSSSMEILSFWLDSLLKLEETGKYRGVCAAGKYKVTVGPEGEIYPCEFLRISLKDLNVDLQSFRGCPAMAYYVKGVIGDDPFF